MPRSLHQVHDPLIQISIGDVGFVVLGVHENLGYPTKMLRIVATGVAALASDLQQEFPVTGELQQMGIGTTISTDPHVVHMVNEDPVV